MVFTQAPEVAAGGGQRARQRQRLSDSPNDPATLGGGGAVQGWVHDDLAGAREDVPTEGEG